MSNHAKKKRPLKGTFFVYNRSTLSSLDVNPEFINMALKHDKRLADTHSIVIESRYQGVISQYALGLVHKSKHFLHIA
ncbi:hypothetical protein OKIT_0976 [Oenococcus kitaharae DSM 17330]|uniref:Uncharacterized protein n=1 Tax=Oenococcus kitaharae DSM 17330 TaxID=1045004 RepID=G9WJN4_9LACO|nr:hypothetical protein OKIT_0976 [Oenococcus kitaharae DSM 17330]